MLANSARLKDERKQLLQKLHDIGSMIVTGDAQQDKQSHQWTIGDMFIDVVFCNGKLMLALLECQNSGGILPFHSHTGIEQYMGILSGKLRVKTRGKDDILKDQGHILKLAGGVEHEIIAEEAPLKAWIIFVPPETQYAIVDGECHLYNAGTCKNSNCLVVKGFQHGEN